MILPLDYLIISLPTLAFDAPAPMTWAAFVERTGFKAMPEKWLDLEIQLKNAIARARGGEKYQREAHGLALFWINRITAAFQESDVLKRDELLDRVFWDAADELTPPSNPISQGALATYAVRLKIALKRSKISAELGNAAFDQLTAETKISL